MCVHKFSTPLSKYQECTCRIVWEEYVWFYKNWPNCLPRWETLFHFAFAPAVSDGPPLFTSSPAFGVLTIPDFDLSSWYVVVFLCLLIYVFYSDGSLSCYFIVLYSFHKKFTLVKPCSHLQLSWKLEMSWEAHCHARTQTPVRTRVFLPNTGFRGSRTGGRAWFIHPAYIYCSVPGIITHVYF